jgi:hypothetical protein
MIKLSWNRDEDGVITVYGTWPNGRIAPVADVWLQPLIDKAGLSRAKALEVQERIADRLCGLMVEESGDE